MIIRPATTADAPGMVIVLNDIIAIGGSTAHETPFNDAKMIEKYIATPNLVLCHVADEDGKILGFQWLRWSNPSDNTVPDDWGVIASFVAGHAAGRGVGQQLFAATKAVALVAGVTAIDATIRADNVAGLRYYGGLGFVDYNRLVGVPLQNGTPVDRICKKFEL